METISSNSNVLNLKCSVCDDNLNENTITLVCGCKIHQGCLGQETGGVSLTVRECSCDETLFSKETFMLGIKKGDLDIVKKELSKTNICLESNDGSNPLSIVYSAPCNSRIAIMKALIDVGVDLDCTDHHNRTILMLSAGIGDLNIVEILIANGASLSILDNEGLSALYYAVSKKKIETIHFLVNKIASNIDNPSYEGSTALQRILPTALAHAVSCNDLNLVKTLIDSKANFSKDFYDILGLAVKQQRIEISKLLIEAGAALVIEKRLGKLGQEVILCAFHAAVTFNNFDIVDLMIKKGAKDIINSVNDDGVTPIHRCVGSDENIEMVRMLISRGANVNAINVKTGSSPLHIAVCGGEGCEQVLDLLLSSKANTNVMDNSKCYPLHLAIMFGYNNMVMKLIDNGADVNAFSNLGDRTLCSLHLSVMFKRETVLSTLLENGANINLVDNNGMTALDMVAKEDGLSGALGKILLDNGAIDTGKVDKSGKTVEIV